MTLYAFLAPLKTESEMNARGHWRVRDKRRKEQHHLVSLLMSTHVPASIRFPVRVRFTRLSAGTLDDDNLRSALKFVRDAVAKHLRVDDGDIERIVWEYAQAKAKRGEPGVYVEIESAKRGGSP